MNIAIGVLSALALGLLPNDETAAGDDTWDQFRDLKVLYAGPPEGTRQEAWVGFVKMCDPSPRRRLGL